jgi:hypothetical protein
MLCRTDLEGIGAWGGVYPIDGTKVTCTIVIPSLEKTKEKPTKTHFHPIEILSLF